MPKKAKPMWPEREKPRMALRADRGTPVFFRPRDKHDTAPWEDNWTRERFTHAQVNQKPRRGER